MVAPKLAGPRRTAQIGARQGDRNDDDGNEAGRRPRARRDRGEDVAYGSVVAPAAAHGARAQRLAGLRDGAGVHAQVVLGRGVPLPDPVLLPVRHRPLRRGAAHFGRFLPGWWIIPDAAFTPAVPAAVPADLLLLPQGVLPVVLAVAAGVRGARTGTRPTPARPASRWSSRTCTGTPSTPPRIISLINTYDAVLAFQRADGLRLRAGQPGPAGQRGHAVGVHRCPAIRAGTSSAAGSSTSPSTRCATGPGPSSPCSTRATCSWPGSPSARWR